MYISDYWDEKRKLIDENEKELFKAFEKDQINIRKMVIMKVMNIPSDGLAFYLHRDAWLKEFAMSREDTIDYRKATAPQLLLKRDQIIENYFYKKDYEILRSLLNYQKNGASDKESVCNLIKELLNPKVYKKLDVNGKRKVELYEKIYFCPTELVNGYLEEKSGKEIYYTMLMEQWKTANEMAANISAQRNNMNNFYMSLMSILIGGILFSNQLLSTDAIAQTVLFLAVSITGGVCCNKWISQIDNYGKLNGVKYEIINELEQHLPANVMFYEWLKTERTARKNKRKINFSVQEKSIAKLFQILVIGVPVIMLIVTWRDEIWTIIQQLLNLK